MKKSYNTVTGASTDAVSIALLKEYNMQAVPRLIADWNLNRYCIPTAINTPDDQDEGVDIDHYPIESIIEPLRPRKGIAKARVNQGVVSAGYIKDNSAKFYVSSQDDVYKYWTSSYPTNGAGTFPNHTDGITSARPSVSYPLVWQANKIVIKLENTWATPKNFEIRINTVVDGDFTSSPIYVNVPLSTAVKPDGTITLWHTGSSWVDYEPGTLTTTPVAGIQFRVTTMGPGIRKDGRVMSYRNRGSELELATTGANSSLNVIAIEAHFQANLTSRLISVDDTFDLSEKSQIYPIGTITSNVATVVLANEDGIFNEENLASPYSGLIEPNAEFDLKYIYTINGENHKVQQFKMFVSSWSNDSDSGTTTVELEDYSKYLKEIKPNQQLIEGKTSSEIIWRVLDSVGFVDYEFSSEDFNPSSISIPVFWTTGQETVWEILDEIAKATQTAIYFDGNGKLQVRSRNAAFNYSKQLDWTLCGQNLYNDLGAITQLADIMSWSVSDEYEANKIDVLYKTTKWKKNSNGNDSQSKVWEPESGGTVALRSTPLHATLDLTDTHFFIEKKDIDIWPFEGKVQIDGEVISYSGKQFVYFTYTESFNGSGQMVYSDKNKKFGNPTTYEEYQRLNRKTPKKYRAANYFTGGFKIVDRELWNTEKRRHPVDIEGYTTYMSLDLGGGSGAGQLSPSGLKHKKNESVLNIKTPSSMKTSNDVFFAYTGGVTGVGYRTYGTRLRFNKAETSQTGLVVQMTSGFNGYYVEVRTTASLGANDRKVANEVSILTGSGNKVILSKGTPVAIAKDIWYDLDVYVAGTGNVQTISVWLNGQMVAEATTDSTTAVPDSARFGFFARGKSDVDFEFLYALNRGESRNPNDYGFYDLKYGGIRGDNWSKESVWGTRTRYAPTKKNPWRKIKEKYRLYFFDEFGPYVHEVREFEVKFDPAPVRYSYLFNTNEWYASVIEYIGKPFGAKFTIANTARFHAILNGEDRLIYAGAGEGVNQVLAVLGQNLEIAEAEKVTVKNKKAIRARGQIESELSSDWIQSRSAAKDIASWIANHWSNRLDEVEVEVFGNPLFEIGDHVTVSYALENVSTETHKYFITSIKTSFDGGLSTSLTLRRDRPANGDLS